MVTVELDSLAASEARGRAGLRHVVSAVVVGALYLGACRAGFLLTPEPGLLAAVWPASGVAFACYWLLGWPGLVGMLAGDAASSIISGADPALIPLFSAGNTFAVWLGVTAVRRVVGRAIPLDTAAGVMTFTVGGALVTSAVAALVGTVGLAVAGATANRGVGGVLETWFLSDVAGVLLVAPLVLAFAERRAFRIDRLGLAKTAMIVLAGLAASWLVFVSEFRSSDVRYALGFVFVPAFVAAAFTLGRRRLMVSVVLAAAIAIGGTAAGRGPFAAVGGADSLLLLQLFLVTLVVTSLLIHGVVSELQQARRTLEQQVEERTAELRESNLQLREQMRERSAAEASRRTLEERLVRAQKMEAVGTLAGGVAHDLNNILTGLVGYPELLLLKLPPDSPLRRPVEIMDKSAQRAAAIVQDLLTLARRSVVTTEVVDLNAVVREHLESPEHERLVHFHPEVRIEVDLGDELLRLKGSPVHLAKMVMNLVSNAAEAITGPGTVRVTTFNRYVDQPIADYDEVAEGEYVVLEVSDDGGGIAAADLAQIFEPFYTKKKLGRSGTGLGMAVVWGTVKDHRGYIEVVSRVDQGTTVTVYLPATRDAIAEQPSVVALEAYRGSESVLVVDDIELQRDMARDILAPLGYRVRTVASGEDGVAALAAEPFDLVVLDMIMAPGIDGLETYRRMLAIRPGQRAIIASGFSETDRVREALRLGAGCYLRKPYGITALAAAVRSELERR